MSRHTAKSAAQFKQLVTADGVKVAAETLGGLVVNEDVGARTSNTLFYQSRGRNVNDYGFSGKSKENASRDRSGNRSNIRKNKEGQVR